MYFCTHNCKMNEPHRYMHIYTHSLTLVPTRFKITDIKCPANKLAQQRNKGVAQQEEEDKRVCSPMSACHQSRSRVSSQFMILSPYGA